MLLSCRRGLVFAAPTRINGCKWSIASDPSDALESHTVTIGHGDPGCQDRLNTLYFRLPKLNEEMRELTN